MVVRSRASSLSVRRSVSWAAVSALRGGPIAMAWSARRRVVAVGAARVGVGALASPIGGARVVMAGAVCRWRSSALRRSARRRRRAADGRSARGASSPARPYTARSGAGNGGLVGVADGVAGAAQVGDDVVPPLDLCGVGVGAVAYLCQLTPVLCDNARGSRDPEGLVGERRAKGAGDGGTCPVPRTPVGSHRRASGFRASPRIRPEGGARP